MYENKVEQNRNNFCIKVIATIQLSEDKTSSIDQICTHDTCHVSMHDNIELCRCYNN